MAWEAVDRPRLYRDMLLKEGSRFTLTEISRIPSVQLMAIFAPATVPNTEFDVLKKVNAIREKKGLPPLARLIGKTKG